LLWNKVQGLLRRYAGSVSPLGLISFNIKAEDEQSFLREALFILQELSSYIIIN